MYISWGFHKAPLNCVYNWIMTHTNTLWRQRLGLYHRYPPNRVIVLHTSFHPMTLASRSIVDNCNEVRVRHSLTSYDVNVNAAVNVNVNVTPFNLLMFCLVFRQRLWEHTRTNLLAKPSLPARTFCKFRCRLKNHR